MSYADIMDHLFMIEDSVRMAAYEEAIRRSVRPGDVVVDLGSGTSVLACLAARAGASLVHALERTQIASVGEAIAEDCGATSVRVFPGASRDFAAPKNVDVLVSEWMGHFAFSERMLESVIELRDRVLKDAGTVVPGHLALQAALVTADAYFERLCLLRRRPCGLDFRTVADWPFQTVHRLRMSPRELAAPVFDLGRFDLKTLQRTPARLQGAARFPEPIQTTGLCGWFAVELVPGVEIDTAPGAPATHWMQLYFPFPEKLEIPPDTAVEVTIWPLHPPGTDSTFWRWRLSVAGAVAVDSNDMAPLLWMQLRARRSRQKETSREAEMTPPGMSRSDAGGAGTDATDGEGR